MTSAEMLKHFKELSAVPADPESAAGYSKLYEFWNELSIRLDSGRELTAAEFRYWDSKVMALPSPVEIQRFQKPLRPHIPLDSDTIQHARHLHLMKILRARQGWERFMTDTGY